MSPRSKSAAAATLEGQSMRLGTRGSPLALAQAQLVADALGESRAGPDQDIRRPRAGRRQVAFRPRDRAGPAGGRGRPGGALRQGPASELPEGLEIAGCRRVRTRGTRSWARRTRWTPCPRAPGSAPRACGAAPSCWRCGRTSSWSTCGATWTPGSSGWRPATSTGWCWPRPACGGSGAPDEIAFEFDPEQLTPSAGQGALVLESRLDDDAEARAADDHAIGKRSPRSPASGQSSPPWMRAATRPSGSTPS